MTVWPNDDAASLKKFYGDPATGEPGRQLVPVVPPFQMFYDGKPVKAIQFHRKAAPALAAALAEIWDRCGKSQARVDALGLSKYSGAYNPRLIRGSTTKWSNHAYGAAIDINAEANGFNTGHGTMPQLAIDAFKRQGALWGGDYQHRTDPMHFEFCSRAAAPVGLIDDPQADADGDVSEEDSAEVGDVPAGIGGKPQFLKLIQSKMAWVSSALGGVSMASVFGFLTDWRTVTAIGIVGLVAYLIYLRSQKP
jgi:hypothetical protein